MNEESRILGMLKIRRGEEEEEEEEKVNLSVILQSYKQANLSLLMRPKIQCNFVLQWVT